MVNRRWIGVCCLAAVALWMPRATHGGAMIESLSVGDVNFESVGALEFAPEGILLVADPRSSSIHALETGDMPASAGKTLPAIKGINEKIGAMAGVPDILIHDLAVHPKSGVAYLSVSRGRGPDAEPLIVRVDMAGKVEILKLEKIAHAKTTLWSGPEPATDRRGRDRRGDTITDIVYADGRVFVAGLSNEEFTSRLGAVLFPFEGDYANSGVQIFHTSHGKWETHSPIRTFVAHEFAEEQYIIAAHVCTPLVKIPVSAIKPGAKIVGETIAELGAGNRPLDMIAYTKNGEDYLLLSNSRYGVLKIAVKHIPDQAALTDPIRGSGGAPFEKIASYQGVVELDKWGDDYAVVLQKGEGGSIDLNTLALP